MGNSAKNLDLEIPCATLVAEALSADLIIRAWKDDSFAESLGTIARSSIPDSPAGVIDLRQYKISGQVRENEIVASSYGSCDSYGSCSSYGSCDSYGSCYSYGSCSTEASDCY